MQLYTKHGLLPKAIFLSFKIVTSHQAHESSLIKLELKKEHVSKRNMRSHFNDDL